MYSIGLFEHAVKVTGISLQFYDIYYRSLEQVKKINSALPKNIRIYPTNDMLTSFDLEQSI